MDKQANSGYTMVSALIVLISLSMFSMFSVNNFQDSYERYALGISMDLCKELILKVKYESFLTKEERDICFYEEYVSIGEEMWEYVKGIRSRDDVCFHYSKEGNVSKTGSVVLEGNKYSQRMSIQIGGGYYEIWDSEDS